MEFTLPVYYTKVFKTKPDTTFLVSMNWYRNAHYIVQNQVKKYYQSLIEEVLKDAVPLTGTYKVTYTYHYRNKSSDLSNVTPMTSKWVNDALQALNLVTNDNVQYLVEEVHKVGRHDSLNPCVEVLIEPVLNFNN